MNPSSKFYIHIYIYRKRHTERQKERERCIYTDITISEFIHKIMILINEKK